MEKEEERTEVRKKMAAVLTIMISISIGLRELDQNDSYFINWG